MRCCLYSLLGAHGPVVWPMEQISVIMVLVLVSHCQLCIDVSAKS